MELTFKAALEAHDFEHDCHYLISIPIALDSLESSRESRQVLDHLIFMIERVKEEIKETYRKDIVEKKFHLKCVNKLAD